MASEGIYWTPARKDAGSRQNGWELLRERLKNGMKPEGPGLFVFNTCRQFISMAPVLSGIMTDYDRAEFNESGDGARQAETGTDTSE